MLHGVRDATDRGRGLRSACPTLVAVRAATNSPVAAVSVAAVVVADLELLCLRLL